MNDKDEKSFEKWWDDKYELSGQVRDWQTCDYLYLAKLGMKDGWQAACEYKQNELDALKLEYDKLTDWASEYKAENKKLREALEFYANNDSYRSKSGGHIQNKSFHSKIGQDCGINAREALLKIKNG